MEGLMCLLVVIGIRGLIISGCVIVYNKIKGNKIESNLWKLLIAFGLSFVIGICFYPIDDTEVEDKDITTQEEQVEDEDSQDSKVEDNTEDEEVVEEPKEETEEPKDTTEDENIDGYVNDNPDPSYNDMSVVDETVESILHSNYSSNSYDVALRNDNGEVKIVIIAKDINLSGVSEAEKEYAMSQSNIIGTYDDLAETVKNVYKEAGFDVSVTIGLFDVNVEEIYIANAY